MRALRTLSVIAALVLTATAGVAAGLEKYKGWSTSPQGYFMTRGEREQWSAIKTDADAEQFVNQFLASRGPDFVKETSKRAEIADKYLTVGKTPGSKTLRGKIIIVFGPPSAFRPGSRVETGSFSAPGSNIMGASGDSGGGSRGGATGSSVAEMSGAATAAGMISREIKEFTITYAGNKLPTPRAEELTVIVEVEAVNGREWLSNKKQMAELDELFDAAATASKTGAKPVK